MIHTGWAATGEVGGYLRFANKGPAPCQLRGWPTVVAVTLAGKTVVAARALHGTMFGAWQYAPPLPELRLRPGAAAYAALAAGDHSGASANRCPSARLLRVSPPGGFGYVTLSAWLYGRVYVPVCTSVDGSTEIQVTAVVTLAELAH
jgi:hypothetical protein